MQASGAGMDAKGTKTGVWTASTVVKIMGKDADDLIPKKAVSKVIAANAKKEAAVQKCAKPRAPKVTGFKVVSCGDCDFKYTAVGGRKPIGLAKCAAYCRKHKCKRFSYGTKNVEGKAG